MINGSNKLHRSTTLLVMSTMMVTMFVFLLNFSPPPSINNDEKATRLGQPCLQPQSKDMPGPSHIPAIYQDDYALCSADNWVLDRNDFLGTKDLPERPYSITNDTFASFHDRPVASLEEFVQAVKLGQRHWRDLEGEILHSERHPSYFVPAKHDIPILSAKQSCAILSQYSHIFTVGDSLTRHLRQGIFMLLRQDLVLGGIHSSKKFGPQNPYQCRCDGQFSEHSMCRQNDGLFGKTTPRELAVCSHLNESEQFHFDASPNWGEANCEDPNAKGVLLYMQGGVHTGSNVQNTVARSIEPHTKSAGFQKCLNASRVHVIWSTYTAQSRNLDSKYPLQSRENALKFNQEMAAYWAKQPFPVTILDWWNLTADSQTSDGFHSLSDVNFVKALHVVHAANWTRHQSIGIGNNAAS